MQKKILPSDVHPDLTEDRLNAIAELIRNQRKDIIGKSEIDRGDNAWSIGCRAYACTCYAITNAASKDDRFAAWLNVLEDQGLYFTFTLGDIPIKFYRGDPENPPGRVSYYRSAEFLARQRAFPFTKNKDNFLFRLIIETDSSFEVSEITLIQIDTDGNTINSWSIDSTRSPNIAPLASKSVKLPKPPIRIKQSAEKETGTGKSNDE